MALNNRYDLILPSRQLWEDPVHQEIIDQIAREHNLPLPRPPYNAVDYLFEAERTASIIHKRMIQGFAQDVMREYLKYKEVIFHPPATIVKWADGTKTVVKCSEKDMYDKEKGLALCFMKRALGNKSRKLNDILHKEVPEHDRPDQTAGCD